MINVQEVKMMLEMPQIENGMTFKQRMGMAKLFLLEISVSECRYKLGGTTAELYYDKMVERLGLVAQMLPDDKNIIMDILTGIHVLAVVTGEQSSAAELEQLIADFK